MKKNVLFLMFISLSLILTLVACGGDSDTSDAFVTDYISDDITTDTQNPIITPTPVPTPTQEPTIVPPQAETEDSTPSGVATQSIIGATRSYLKRIGTRLENSGLKGAA